MFTINDINYFDSLTEAKLAILAHLDGREEFKELAELIRISIENHEPKDKFLARLEAHSSFHLVRDILKNELECLKRSSFELTGLGDRNKNPLLGAAESFLTAELLVNPTDKMQEVTRKITNVLANTLMAHMNDPGNKNMEHLRYFAKAIIFEDSRQYPGGIKHDRVNELISEHNETASENNQIPLISQADLSNPGFTLSDAQTRLIISAVVDNLQSPRFDLMEHMTFQEVYGYIVMKNVPLVLPQQVPAAVLDEMSAHPDYQTVLKAIGNCDEVTVHSMNDFYTCLQDSAADPTVRKFISDNMMYESDLYRFEKNKGRGQPQVVLTNTLGIVRGDNPALRQGLPTASEYEWIDWTTCEFFTNSKIVESMVTNEVPFISSYSGSASLMMNLMLSTFALPELSDRQAYLESVMAYIVGVGFHSQHEIMAPIAYCLNLIPQSEYPVELPIAGRTHAPQYNNVYQMLAGSDPQFAAKREIGWSKMMDWFKDVYKLHCQKDMNDLLMKVIEHYPQAKDKKAAEEFILNMLNSAEVKLSKNVISLFMQNGSESMITLILQKTQGNQLSTKDLLAAIESKNVSAVRAMVAIGIDVNKGDPLIAALERGQNEIALLLLEKGANADVRSNTGFSPLALVYKENDVAIVRALLEHGADINAFNMDGNPPLHDLLSSEEPNFAMIKLFLDKGADLEARDEFGEGRTPLEVAVDGGNVEVVRLVLSRFTPEQLAENRGALIERAADAGHEEVAALFEEKNEEVHEEKKGQGTSQIWRGLNISGRAPLQNEDAEESNSLRTSGSSEPAEASSADEHVMEKGESEKAEKGDRMGMKKL